MKIVRSRSHIVPKISVVTLLVLLVGVQVWGRR